MDSSRLLDSARDPYARRQTPSMALSSGQAYYTVESLEGASSLPGSFAPSAPHSSERDAILRLDAQTRALLADRETLDARTRLLAAEREASLRWNLSGHPSLADRRAYADGLPPVDAGSRLDGLPPVDARVRLDGLPSVDARVRHDGLPPLDARSRLDGLPPDTRTRLSHDELQAILPRGLDARSHDAMRPGLDNIPRAPVAAGGLALGAQEHISLSDFIRLRELPAGARSGPFHPPADPLHARRDISDVRAATVLLDSLLPRRENASRPDASFGGPSERSFQLRTREPAVPTARKKVRVSKKKRAAGYCAVCKIDCFDPKTLIIHQHGKKHKSVVEGNSGKVNEPSEEGKSETTDVTGQAERKRASDAEASQSAKRPKTVVVNGAPTAVAADSKNGKVDQNENVKNPYPQVHPLKQVCEVCNIFTTGQKNLESHLKGKLHAARVKELANS